MTVISSLLLKNPVFSQVTDNQTIDSLEKRLHNLSPEDTTEYIITKLRLANQLISSKQPLRADTIISLVLDTLELLKIERKYLGNALLIRANIYENLGNDPLALSTIQDAAKIFQETNDTLGQIRCLKMLGGQWSTKYPEKSLEYYNDALELCHASSDTTNTILTLGLIAVIYERLHKKEEAIVAYENAFELSKAQKDPIKTIAYAITLGTNNELLGKHREALKYYQDCLSLCRKSEDIEKQFMLVELMQTIYRQMNEIEKEKELEREKALLLNQLQDGNEKLQTFIYLANFLSAQKKSERAIYYGEKAFEMANNMEDIPSMTTILNILDQSYIQLEDTANAYLAIKRLERLNRIAVNQELSAKIAEYETQYKTVKKDKEIAMLTSRKEKQELWIMFIISVAALLLLFLAFIFNRLRVTRNQKILIEDQKKLVDEYNIQLNETNGLLENQRNMLATKNQEITDSIHYALRIQSALIPTFESINQLLPNSFIWYQPKDVVSGDFYFVESLEDENAILFAVADCTGHGAPGAMVSVICINALTRCIHEYNLRKPSEILDKARELVLETFIADNHEVKDGMDIALCKWDRNNHTLEYSGANNPLYLLKSKDSDITVIKADREPVGATEQATNFTNHSFELEPGDLVYLFSDGLADQFGGPKGKKFGYKNLRKLLLAQSEKPLSSQKELISKAIQEWMHESNEEQLDDICMIGIRF